MSDKRYKHQHHADQTGPSTPVGEDTRTRVDDQPRYLGWNKDFRMCGRHLRGQGHDLLAPLGSCKTTREPRKAELSIIKLKNLANHVETWKVEVWEREGTAALCTLTGRRDEATFEFVAQKFDAAKLPGVPPAGYDLHVPLGVRVEGDLAADPRIYVPLKADEDDPDDWWDLYLKVYADDKIVQGDPDLEPSHVWLDWPDGRILRPMLGAPALVKEGDWLECLVVTNAPLPEGAEKFYLQSQLRIHPWGDEEARQAAFKKRTFTLYDDAIQFARYTVGDIATDADEYKDRAFKLKLSRMQHADLANLVEDSAAYASAASEGGPDVQKMLAMPVYKVRIKLGRGAGLYNLVWMNAEDLDLANFIVNDGKSERILLLQDRRLRWALTGLQGRSDDERRWNGCQLFEYDGHAMGRRRKPTRNRRVEVPPGNPDDPRFVRAYHPVSVCKSELLKVGHLTDIHLSVRLDIMSQNNVALLPEGPGLPDMGPYDEALATSPIGTRMNNTTDTFVGLADQVLGDEGADVLLLTGDLADFQRDSATEGPKAIPLRDATDASRRLENTWAWHEAGAVDEFVAARNWVHIYQVLLDLYDRHKKPIFTMAGNHDYRPNAYSFFPGAGGRHSSLRPYAILSGDANLTVYEGLALYGPEYANNVAAIASLTADPSSPRWYELAINGFRDYEICYGDQSLLCLDWDVEEDYLEFGTGHLENADVRTGIEGASRSVFHLSRAARFMTKTQEAIYARWVARSGRWKVLATHAPLVCNNPTIGIPNSVVRQPGVVLGEIVFGTMGRSNHVTGGDSVPARELREKLACDVIDGRVQMILGGHSHMDGIYDLHRSWGRDAILVRMRSPGWPEDSKQWGNELPFPVTEAHKKAVVTNAGGPLGQFCERQWSRRSRPAGAVFTFDSGTITHKHVPSKDTIPRRCVHDDENDRIPGNAFQFECAARERGKMLPPCKGSFDYTRDPEDPSLNAIIKILFVVWRPPLEDTPGFWQKSEGAWINASDVPTYGGDGKMHFKLPRQILAWAAHWQKTTDPRRGRSFVVLKYGWNVVDDWVIEVVASGSDTGKYSDILYDPWEAASYTLTVQEFPEFDGTDPRFKTKTG